MRKSLTSGIFFTGISKYSNVLVSLVIGAILARLLTPEEFGIIAIVTVFVTFFNLISNFGIGPAIVQHQLLKDEDIRSIFSLSLILGFVFASLFYIVGPSIANYYEEPELKFVSRYFSLAIFFFTIQIVPYALSQKKLKFKELGIISTVIQIISGSIAVLLAFKGFSYYTLVFKSIFDAIATFMAFYWLSPVQLTLKIRKKSIEKIAKFSIYQFMFNFVNYFSRNTDNLLIGKFFSSTALGYYDKSYNLMTLPVANLTHVITPVLMPVLSKFQDDKQKVYKAYLKVVKILATIGFPLSIFLYFVGSEIVNIIYGPQWEQSVPIFKLLALTVGIQMVLSSSGSIFQVVNRTDLLFYSGLLSAIVMVTGIAYGIFIGKSLEAVAYGLIAAFTINFFQCFYLLIKLSLNSSLQVFLKIFISPLLNCFFVGIALLIADDWNFPNLYTSLFVKTIVAITTFTLFFISYTRNRQILRDVFEMKKG